MSGGRIDVHGHHLPPVYVGALRAAGRHMIGGIPVPDWSPDLALGFMDAHGIALQLLSISDPGVEFVDAAGAPALARACNDDLAAVIAAHPGRFGGLAVVSMRDVDDARREAARAFDDLRFAGVGLLSSYDGRYLGDPAFDALLADLDARGAFVFVHPTAITAAGKPDLGVPDFIAEYPFDTTRTIISLLVNGAFARHPRIRWHFAHGGGTVAMLRRRLIGLAEAAPLVGPLIGLPAGSAVLTAASPVEALSAASFDTALVDDPPALRAIAEMAGADRLLFGSDWPFAARLYGPGGDPQPALREVFDPAACEAIERGNAAAAFGVDP